MGSPGDPVVYLNGAMTPLSAAKISVLDRGFIFGDGVYEVLPFYKRKPFRAAQHMARLARSLREIAIANPYTAEQWLALIGQVVAAQPADNQLAYLQVTRGVAKRGHAFPADAVPTVFIMSNGWEPPSDEQREQGIVCVALEDKRWHRCDIKSISLLGNVLAAQYAVEHQAAESIQFRDGFLTEGAASNIWIVKNGQVLGPPKDNLILEGIRYGLIEEVCSAAGIPMALRPISREEVFAADEVILSSAGKEVLPVVAVDGKPIASGKPGPVFKKLYAAYQAAKAAQA
jgi:D-alanine transaminase